MPTKVHIVKAMDFPVVIYRFKSWTIEKAENWRIGASKFVVLGRPLRVPWTARRSSHSTLKEINTEYSLEGLMLSLQYFSHLMGRANSLGKDPDSGKDWSQEEKGVTKDEKVGWHRQLNGHEFEQTPGDSEGQGSLECCSPWHLKELDTAQRLNNNILLSFNSLDYFSWVHLWFSARTLITLNCHPYLPKTQCSIYEICLELDVSSFSKFGKKKKKCLKNVLIKVLK